MMERLTFEGNFCDIAMCRETPGGSFCENGMCSQRKVWERLKHYEDLEEQGRLQIFPCAPGATVYVTDLVDGEVVPCEVLCFGDLDGSGEMTVEYKVPKEIPNIVSMLCGVSEFGKTLFLTREEAEQALKGGAEA